RNGTHGTHWVMPPTAPWGRWGLALDGLAALNLWCDQHDPGRPAVRRDLHGPKVAEDLRSAPTQLPRVPRCRCVALAGDREAFSGRGDHGPAPDRPVHAGVGLRPDEQLHRHRRRPAAARSQVRLGCREVMEGPPAPATLL